MNNQYLMNTYARFDVIFEKGIGSKLYDTKGREYIDFVAGVAVNCLGHNHPVIVNALAEQSKMLMHVSNLYWNVPQLELAEMLGSHSKHDKVFFCNSGTEAVESAVKLARKYGRSKGEGKYQLLYMENSFHGRTMGALAVTGQEKYQASFMPLMEGVEMVKFNSAEDLTQKMNDGVCGVIIEPIQGEGGVLPASKEFLETARKLCDQYDALLIYDEVQCGIGRTGKLFAYEMYGIVPDILCIAKGLGGGFPIGAMMAVKKAADAFVPGDHGCTFGGNPLACAVSLAVLKELIYGGIIEKVEGKSRYIIEKMNVLIKEYKNIEGIQGMGLMLGIRLESDSKVFVEKCFERGLLTVGAGKNVVRLVPPLNVGEDEIDEAMLIIREVLEETKA